MRLLVIFFLFLFFFWRGNTSVFDGPLSHMPPLRNPSLPSRDLLAAFLNATHCELV